MLLQVSGIIKRFGVDPILDGVNLQILERERIGLVGVNGAGKSTLLKIIAGEMSYDGGQIFKSKETTLGYLAQNSGLQSDRSIWEEMMHVFAHLTQTEAELRQMEHDIADPARMENEKQYADLLERYARRSDWFKDHGGYEMETRIRSVLHGMGFGEFAPDTPISTLSGGQKTRLALARILLQAPDLLMLDEPTNYLDIATLTWLEDYLRGYSGALLVVSHDRYFLDRLVTTIVEIERHRSKKYTGNYSRYMELKAAEYEIQMKQYEKQQDEISKMEDFVQKNIVRASTTKRAQSRRKALEKMDRLDKPLGDLKKAHFSFETAVMSGKEVLRVDQLSVAYEEGSPLFRNVSFDLRRGETVALIGPNGIGKSTMLKCLTGSLRPAQGDIQWGTKVQIGYYDQEQTGLNPSNTVLEELWSAYPGMEEARIRTVLGNFLFSGDDVLKKISSLSGGEKARVSLSKLMLKEANVLILDEPTNHLDLFAKEVLEAALMDYEGTLLFISHDRYFLNKMAERIVELHSGGTEQYLGNYDDYVEKKLELEEIAREAAEARQASSKSASSAAASANSATTEKSGAASFEADKQAKREERNRQRRQEALEQQIAELESEITSLEEQMALPEVYQDYMKLQELQQSSEEHKTKLAKAYEEWETLAMG
ncbi:ABC-F family ATP-binding cassette domain-containing protein [Paenibacillus polysaccharolyticus]|uniref:ABC-F family ATP-binding cassette domain-containing protein n=1 Tax=Paenibacillus polysaccharolyticus TaxID=582692 RepID=UPI0020414F57|nr:ABC-F family ATP-binding cassette domain-containing protein [Paenibacillus polysaccharolyticus]MCM3135367.1 ABC-F family ATP-binding cassette domain-containing protein [Paenibacillus polysaccharolyticus]